MYSAARVNQFEMKDMCIEFVINVSRQGNNVKIKLNLKIDLQRLRGNKGNTPGFCLDLSEAYSLPCETNNVKCFAKIVNG